MSATKETVITIGESGILSFVYDDELLPLIDDAKCSTIERASHVEPAELPDGGIGWGVDLSPVGGPALLGVYRERSAALAAEVAWLKENVLT